MPKIVPFELIVCFFLFAWAANLVNDAGGLNSFEHQGLTGAIIILGLAYYLTHRVCQERKIYREDRDSSSRSDDSEINEETDVLS